MSARRNRRKAAAPAPSPSPACDSAAPLMAAKNAVAEASAADLRSWVDSRVDALRADSEQLHSGLGKELESGAARIKKRMNAELEGSSRHGEEANRAWKTFAAEHGEDVQEIQSVCKEFQAKAQSQAASFKASIGDFLASVDHQLDGLRSKHARV